MSLKVLTFPLGTPKSHELEGAVVKNWCVPPSIGWEKEGFEYQKHFICSPEYQGAWADMHIFRRLNPNQHFL